MRIRSLIAASIVLSSAGFFAGAAGTTPQGASADPEALIRKAAAVIALPDPDRDEAGRALAGVLEAAGLIQAKAPHAAAFKAHIDAARAVILAGSFASDSAQKEVAAAYKLASGGKAWELPKGLEGRGRDAAAVDVARDIARKLLETALASLKAGRGDAATLDCLSFILLVITPIEA